MSIDNHSSSNNLNPYLTDKEHVKETLSMYGVAIVTNVLTEKECNSMIDGIWDYFEKKTSHWEKPISRNEKETWKKLSLLHPIYSMLHHYGDVGHAPFAWEIRQKPAILDIFSTLWECLPHELLVSFDGMSFLPPPEMTDIGWFEDDTWFHSDQSFTRNEFECMQGWVTATDVEEGDGTLAFYEGSHRFHKAFAEAFPPKTDSDWCPLRTQEEEDFFSEKGCEIKAIQCPKGSLVLWDSRTIHCGIKPRRDRPTANTRAVQYLCYMPRRLCFSNDVLEYKQWAFENRRTTNHYPCNPTAFPKQPRELYNQTDEEEEEEGKKEDFVLNEIGYCLAGYHVV